jgi:hypothetical protein
MELQFNISQLLGNPKRRLLTLATRNSYLEVFRVGDRTFDDLKDSTVYYDAYYGSSDGYEVVFFKLHPEMPGETPDPWTWAEIQRAVLFFSSKNRFGEPAIICARSTDLIYKSPYSYIDTFYKDTSVKGFILKGNPKPIGLFELWEVGY